MGQGIPMEEGCLGRGGMPLGQGQPWGGDAPGTGDARAGGDGPRARDAHGAGMSMGYLCPAPSGMGTRCAWPLPALCWQERLLGPEGFGVRQEGPNPWVRDQPLTSTPWPGRGPHPAPSPAGLWSLSGCMVPVGPGCRAGGEQVSGARQGTPGGQKMLTLVAMKGLPSAAPLANPTPSRASPSCQPLPPPKKLWGCPVPPARRWAGEEGAAGRLLPLQLLGGSAEGVALGKLHRLGPNPVSIATCSPGATGGSWGGGKPTQAPQLPQVLIWGTPSAPQQAYTAPGRGRCSQRSRGCRPHQEPDPTGGKEERQGFAALLLDLISICN